MFCHQILLTLLSYLLELSSETFYFLQIVHLDYTAFTVRKPVASFVKTKTVIKQTAPAQTVVEVDIQDAIAMKVRV